MSRYSDRQASIHGDKPATTEVERADAMGDMGEGGYSIRRWSALHLCRKAMGSTLGQAQGKALKSHGITGSGKYGDRSLETYEMPNGWHQFMLGKDNNGEWYWRSIGGIARE